MAPKNQAQYESLLDKIEQYTGVKSRKIIKSRLKKTAFCLAHAYRAKTQDKKATAIRDLSNFFVTGLTSIVREYNVQNSNEFPKLVLDYVSTFETGFNDNFPEIRFGPRNIQSPTILEIRSSKPKLDRLIGIFEFALQTNQVHIPSEYEAWVYTYPGILSPESGYKDVVLKIKF